MKRVGLALLLPFVLAVGPTSPSRQPHGFGPLFSASYSQLNGQGLCEKCAGFTAAFTNAGDLTRNQRSTGTITSVTGPNVAAIGSPLLSNQLQTLKADGLWLGPSITVEGLDNEVINGWTDVGTPNKTANNRAAPSAANTADTIEDDHIAVLEGVLHTADVAATTDVFVATVWHYCASTHNISLRLTIGAGITTTVTACSATWTKARVAQAGDGATIVATVALFPTDANDLSAVGVTDFWRPQLWRTGTTTDPSAWYPDPEPLTTTAEVTVNADRMDYTGGFQPPLGAGTFCIWMNAKEYIADTYNLFSWDSTNDFRIGIVEGATDRIEVFVDTSTDDGTVNSAGVTIVNGAWHHVCVTVAEASDALSIYLDGAEVAYNTTDRTWTDGESTYGTSMGVGGTEGASKGINGYVSRPKIWNRVLSSGKITNIYNRELVFYQ